VNIKAMTALTPHPAIDGAKPAKKPASTALQKAAEELETSFVRQLLEEAKIGGKGAENGYGSMAVDALAKGIQAGGGMGLARQIERALDRQHEVETAKPTTPELKR
jgi:Rod binding domain-containing protein